MNAESYRGLTPKQIFRQYESEKKRIYASRVLEVEQGSFTPLVFTTTGGMACECMRYHSRLAELLSTKKEENYSITMSWLRAKVSFAIMISALLCLRGSRCTRRAPLNIADTDFETRDYEVRERIPVPHDNYFQSSFSSRHAILGNYNPP